MQLKIKPDTENVQSRQKQSQRLKVPEPIEFRARDSEKSRAKPETQSPEQNKQACTGWVKTELRPVM